MITGLFSCLPRCLNVPHSRNVSNISNFKGESFVSAPGFRGLSPLPVCPVAFGSVTTQSIIESVHTEQRCLSCGVQETNTEKNASRTFLQRTSFLSLRLTSWRFLYPRIGEGQIRTATKTCWTGQMRHDGYVYIRWVQFLGEDSSVVSVLAFWSRRGCYVCILSGTGLFCFSDGITHYLG